MKKIIALFSMLLLFTTATSKTQIKDNEEIMENNNCSIQESWKQDKTLKDADKNIGFIKAFELEDLNKKIIGSYPDITREKLTLENKILFEISHTQPPQAIVKNKINTGIMYIYRFTDLTHKEGELILELYVFDVNKNVDGYCLARSEFISAISATSMPYIPFKKSPLNIGTVSVSFDEKLSPFGQLAWVDHNIYFRVNNRKLPENIALKLVEWASKQRKEQQLR